MAIVVGIAFNIEEGPLARIKALEPAIEVRLLHELGGFAPAPTDPEVIARMKAELADVEVLFGASGIASEFFDAAPKLRWFQVATAGTDRLAKDGLLDRGFTVTNVSGLAAVGIAEWCVGAMVALAKGFHTAARDQLQHKWAFHWTGELQGKTVGIIGMGAIGRETARRAKAFGMRVLATRRTVHDGETDRDCDGMFPYTELNSVLEQSDYVVLCVPLTPETRHLIGVDQLKRMKPTASLLNIARGPVIDQGALIAALRDGTIASAALDVTDPEPLPSDNPLWDLSNVLITPHSSGAIEGYFARMVDFFLANLERYIRGEELENIVDPELGY